MIGVRVMTGLVPSPLKCDRLIERTSYQFINMNSLDTVLFDELKRRKKCLGTNGSAAVTASCLFFFGEEPVVELAFDEVELSTGRTGESFGWRPVSGCNRSGLRSCRFHHFLVLSSGYSPQKSYLNPWISERSIVLP